MPRKAIGDRPLSDAERQARRRERLAAIDAGQSAELERLRARVAELEGQVQPAMPNADGDLLTEMQQHFYIEAMTSARACEPVREIAEAATAEFNGITFIKADALRVAGAAGEKAWVDIFCRLTHEATEALCAAASGAELDALKGSSDIWEIDENLVRAELTADERRRGSALRLKLVERLLKRGRTGEPKAAKRPASRRAVQPAQAAG